MSTSEASNLISPTRNLLPAAANPLNPRDSPYYSKKHSLGVAPHPSELPLPTLSFTPPRETLDSITCNYSGTKNNDHPASPVSSQIPINDKDCIENISGVANSKRSKFFVVLFTN